MLAEEEIFAWRTLLLFSHSIFFNVPEQADHETGQLDEFYSHYNHGSHLNCGFRVHDRAGKRPSILSLMLSDIFRYLSLNIVLT